MSTVSSKYSEILFFIKELYPGIDIIPLHAPVFIGNEKKYLLDCIDSTFVSYLGAYVNRFEEMIREYTGAKYAIATVNGTAALEIALKIAGVKHGDEVITQPLTFIATVNAVSYCNAIPVFVDNDIRTLGLSAGKLDDFLKNHTKIGSDGFSYNKETGNRIMACVPVHIFGQPCEIDSIIEICSKYNITVIEDAAESIGSKYKDQHTGTFSKLGILSFNGNKTITTGGGGMIITNDHDLAEKARHITTTAKIPHPWEFIHDQVGYNYRMPNVNAAIGCAQMEKINDFIQDKRLIASEYKKFFSKIGMSFFNELPGCYSNYWLNAIITGNLTERDEILKITNENNIKTRPAWKLMNDLNLHNYLKADDLENAKWLYERIVNLPSGCRINSNTL